MADTSVKVSFIGDAKKLKSTIDGVDKEIDNLGKNSKSFGAKFTDGFQKALPVLAGVGAGVAILGSALKAAVEDEAEQKKLSTTLINVANATNEQIAATEKWIDSAQRATGIADSELRPAYDHLVRGTGELKRSQELLALAMDISTGTGKPLVEVADALSKAYNGNLKSLVALDPQMKILVKEGATTTEIFENLGQTFSGQTAVHAETLEGKMARLKIAMDEAKETLGAKLMPVAIQFTTWLTDTAIPKAEEIAGKIAAWWEKQDGLHQALREAGVQLREFIEDLKTFVEWVQAAVEWTDRLAKKITSLPGGDVSGMDIINKLPGGDKGLIDMIRGKAAGGPVSGGTPYVVGERGPELFVPGRSGSIIPNGAGGGQTFIFEMNGRELARALIDEGDKSGGLPIRIRAAS